MPYPSQLHFSSILSSYLQIISVVNLDNIDIIYSAILLFYLFIWSLISVIVFFFIGPMKAALKPFRDLQSHFSCGDQQDFWHLIN